MIKFISIFCVASILLGVIGFTLFMLRQRQTRHKSAFRQFGQQYGFALFETTAALEPFHNELARFNFFRTGSSSRIRLLIQGKDKDLPVEIMVATLTQGGMNQGFTDEYAVIRWRHSRLNLPHFALQPKEYAVERALNALLVGEASQVSLAAYPALSEQYQLTSAEPEAVSRLFGQGLGDYLDQQIQQSRHRSLEGIENQFLYFTYLKDDIKDDALYQLYEESKHVLKLLEQASTT